MAGQPTRHVFVSTDPVGAPKRYGNALLTRRPILAQGEHLLQPLDDYRTVAHLRINVDGKAVNAYATHFNERSDENGQRIRRTQVEDPVALHRQHLSRRTGGDRGRLQRAGRCQ